MHEDRAPVIVGVAQLCQRDVDPSRALGPLDALEHVAREAARDAGARAAALEALDAVALVGPLAWAPRNGPRLVKQRLGASGARELQAALGGESPLRLVNHLAERIAAGELASALIVGTHHVRTLRRARAEGVRLDWEAGGEGEPELLGSERPGTNDAENACGLTLPPIVYPLFENALRARRGLDLEAHRARMGALMSRFTRVAAANPYAWFPVERSAAELVTRTPANRMIAFPYTKYLNAVMETDQSAAVWLTSADTARALGIPESRRVHWWGGAHASEEAWFPSERPDLAACPSLRAAALGALAPSGTPLDAVHAFDFYSCFPSAVSMACEVLGLAEDDPRGLTVTGGLPYAGGPGNGYTLHALAAMVERLRARPGERGLVTGNGWYLTKHAATLLGSAPPPGEGEGVPDDAPRDGLATKPVTLLDEAEGRAHVETYTVVYDREGAPIRGIVVGRLGAPAAPGLPGAGRRFLANTPRERALLEDFAAREAVGRPGRVERRDDRNVFLPD